MSYRFTIALVATMFATQGYAAPATTEAPATVTKAVAVLHPTEGNKVEGTVTFTAVEGGVLIVADVKNLTPGKHGFHVHEHGDCSAHDASSAGGHFNPTKTKHGGPDSAERHVGDFGNLEANQDGVAHYERIDKIISLNGPDTIVKRSIVVHADADDLVTQPTGNSGARVACGVIE
jgi:Cu-Zn family superoxide dismutase